MRCHQVHVHTVMFEDRGAALIRTVQQLPALEYLDIGFWGIGGRELEALSERTGCRGAQRSRRCTAAR